MRRFGWAALLVVCACSNRGTSARIDGGATDGGYAATCFNGLMGEDETDRDCGGSCPACAVGARCGRPTDCESVICQSSYCLAPTCTDGATNGAEADVDCGGDDCPPCAVGRSCGAPADCVTDVCVGNHCAAPSCTDGLANGSETDVDCGAGCPPCAAGMACEAPSDCVDGACEDRVCAASHCGNAMLDGNETDVDCGGANSCPRCADGMTCRMAEDCTSSMCDGTLCGPAGTCEFIEATYAWIPRGGTRSTVSDRDDGEESVDIGFAYPFFGSSYATATISSNGFIQLGGAVSATSYDNGSLPDATAPNGLVAAFWDDLDPSDGGSVYYEHLTTPTNRFVVTYEDVAFYSSSDRATFQLVLHENGGIAYQYETLTGTSSALGGGATIGVESPDGTRGTAHSVNMSTLRNGLNLTYTCPLPPGVTGTP